MIFLLQANLKQVYAILFCLYIEFWGMFQIVPVIALKDSVATLTLSYCALD